MEKRAVLIFYENVPEYPSALPGGGEWPPLSPGRLCRKGENGKNVMLNLFQYLIKPNSYETLKRVQGDKITIATQSREENGKLRGKG